MIGNFSKVLGQSQGLVVVDNGSSTEAVTALMAGREELGYDLILNDNNLGIAVALNQGIQLAKEEGYSWVFLFDQDSGITEDLIKRMFAAWETHSHRDLLGAIHPRYVHPVSGIEPKVVRARDGGPVTSLTSGSLMPIWIFDKVGWFASEYFIDQVDTEFDYRIRSFGFLIADAQDAILQHSAGRPQTCEFLGFNFSPTHHSPMRRYYMSRNRVAVWRRYFFTFPMWVLRSMIQSLRETIKCFIAEEDRRRKFRNFVVGTWDGLTGKMGKREDI
jgi:rhamnosyltransferase